MERPTDAEFEILKRKRDEAVNAVIDAVCAKQGWPRDKVHAHMCGAGGCYCACPDGPCQHDFQGWREFEDGCGGEQVCTKCGTGAMSHSLRTGL
jgi:hypothetical protein